MSEDSSAYDVKVKLIYLDIAIDYLLGLPYSEIQAKYSCNNGYIQYALERAGVETNRIKSGARLNNSRKKRVFSKELIARMKENAETNKRYDERKRIIHCTMGKQKDNNPVHMADDLDIMERLDDCDGVDYPADDDKNLRYNIVVTKEGKIKYDNNGSGL